MKGSAGQVGAVAISCLAAALDSGVHTAEVLEDEQLAMALGVSGVPIMVFRPDGAGWEDALAVSGAVPYTTMEAALRQVLEGA